MRPVPYLCIYFKVIPYLHLYLNSLCKFPLLSVPECHTHRSNLVQTCRDNQAEEVPVTDPDLVLMGCQMAVCLCHLNLGLILVWVEMLLQVLQEGQCHSRT